MINPYAESYSKINRLFVDNNSYHLDKENITQYVSISKYVISWTGGELRDLTSPQRGILGPDTKFHAQTRALNLHTQKLVFQEQILRKTPPSNPSVGTSSHR